MGNIQFLLSKTVGLFFYVMEFMIFIRILMSWLPMGYNNPIGQFLYHMTEPILGPARRLLDKSPLGSGMGIDISPILALIVMRLVQQLVLGAIMMF